MAYIDTDFMRAVVQSGKKVVHHISESSVILEKNPHRFRTLFLDPDTISTMCMMVNGKRKKKADNQTLKFVYCEFIESAAGKTCT